VGGQRKDGRAHEGRGGQKQSAPPTHGGVRGRRCRVELGHMPVDVLLVLTTPATIKMM